MPARATADLTDTRRLQRTNIRDSSLRCPFRSSSEACWKKGYSGTYVREDPKYMYERILIREMYCNFFLVLFLLQYTLYFRLQSIYIYM